MAEPARRGPRIWEHWVINREWWRDPPCRGCRDGPGQPELKFWRVEAAPGQGMTPDVCELRQDVATGAWTIRLTNPSAPNR